MLCRLKAAVTRASCQLKRHFSALDGLEEDPLLNLLKKVKTNQSQPVKPRKILDEATQASERRRKFFQDVLQDNLELYQEGFEQLKHNLGSLQGNVIQIEGCGHLLFERKCQVNGSLHIVISLTVPQSDNKKEKKANNPALQEFQSRRQNTQMDDLQQFLGDGSLKNSMANDLAQADDEEAMPSYEEFSANIEYYMGSNKKHQESKPGKVGTNLPKLSSKKRVEAVEVKGLFRVALLHSVVLSSYLDLGGNEGS